MIHPCRAQSQHGASNWPFTVQNFDIQFPIRSAGAAESLVTSPPLPLTAVAHDLGVGEESISNLKFVWVAPVTEGIYGKEMERRKWGEGGGVEAAGKRREEERLRSVFWKVSQS